MPEYLAPGVYVEETSFRSKPIEGVSTSACGLIGSIRRGGDAIVEAAGVLMLGVLLGLIAAIAVDKGRRRRQLPPTP